MIVSPTMLAILHLPPPLPQPLAPMYPSSRSQMFGGWVRKYRHQSTELGCEMVFSVFFPPAAAVQGAKVPVRGPSTGHRSSRWLLPSHVWAASGIRQLTLTVPHPRRWSGT